ncbi:MAG: efflux RND transporter periplasmic adaptor subunit [Bacteroidota bacterium]|nr:efflux RND transporter periplasmic adaptor subunit [Bacteroidota bacterium]
MVLLVAMASSCGQNGNDTAKGNLAKMKQSLAKMQAEKVKLDGQITSLEKDIAKLDTSATALQKPKLVALTTVKSEPFTHYLELQGTVDNRNVSYITPTGQPGQIKAIYVNQGDRVHKGQLILKLDDAVAMQNVQAIRQQLGGIRAQLALAKSVYERQKNLWDQNIGTQVQLMQDKTNVELLESQLKAVEANAQTAQAQADQSKVYSDVNGVVDAVTAHVGETFTGNPAAGGYIRIVNESNLKIDVTIPENYAVKVKVGTPVIIEVPDTHQSFKSSISFISQTIGVDSRGFAAEARVPAGYRLMPNQVTIVKIQDYSVPSAVVINVNTLQTDEEGKYVLVAEKNGDRMIARKHEVVPGEFYGDQIEIKQGLQPGEQLITEGYQSIYDGQAVTTSAE